MASDFNVKTNIPSVIKTINNYINRFGSAKKPLTAVLQMLYKHFEKAFQFSSDGNSFMPELSQAYGNWKFSQAVDLPMLVLSGDYKDSITKRGGDNVAKVTNDTLIFGSETKSDKGAPYPSFLHLGTEIMPSRKSLFIDEELAFQISRIFFRVALKEARKARA